ncbi:unnamed protein product, partial [Bubo scandiacus]
HGLLAWNHYYANTSMQLLVASESKQTSAHSISHWHILNVPIEATSEFIFSVHHQRGFQPILKDSTE